MFHGYCNEMLCSVAIATKNVAIATKLIWMGISLGLCGEFGLGIRNMVVTYGFDHVVICI